jgi:hypothetical protein
MKIDSRIAALLTLSAVSFSILFGRLAAGGPAAAAADIHVPAGADLQAAIDRAKPGDVITLEPGATYVGNFTLPATTGSEYITLRSAAESSRFPEGRVGPEHEKWMPTLRSPNVEPALATKPGAHHWRLQWLAFRANQDGFNDIITLGDGSDEARDPRAVPHHLTLDALIIRGDAAKGQKRAIALNSASTIIRNCDIREIKAIGQDSQAIAGWNGPGPFTIENNYLEAAGENIMFGGADPAIRDLVPSDITIAGNYLTKPLEWRVNGSPWTVKNLFELKNARRVLVEHNVFEHNWEAAQPGYAILFTPNNQDGRAPWTVVSDVTFRYNIVRHVSSAINILGYDYTNPSRQTRQIEIRQNLFYDVDASKWGGEGRFLLVNDEPDNIVVDHNTVVQSGSILQLAGRQNGRAKAIRNFQLTNNLFLHNEYGIIGDELGIGKEAIDAYMMNKDIRRNVLAGADSSLYPPDNFFPSVNEFFRQFVNPSQGDYRLIPTSRFRTAATDGSSLGADMDAILREAPTRDPRDRKDPRRVPGDIR